MPHVDKDCRGDNPNQLWTSKHDRRAKEGTSSTCHGRSRDPSYPNRSNDPTSTSRLLRESECRTKSHGRPNSRSKDPKINCLRCCRNSLMRKVFEEDAANIRFLVGYPTDRETKILATADKQIRLMSFYA